MIFGFNTDIKVDETVYHVQSEARVAEKLLQTQVFVKGYCIGKRAVSYAAQEDDGQSEDSRHEQLREQHKAVIHAIREGHVDTVIESSTPKAAASTSSPSSPAVPAPVETPAEVTVEKSVQPIRLKLLGSSRPTEDALVIRFSASSGEVPAEGANLKAEILAATNKTETFSGAGAAEGKTDAQGIVELSLPLPPNPQGEASLVVQVRYADVTSSKRFRIKTQA
jgi:hypothetical protein